MQYPELLQALFHLSKHGGVKYGLDNTLKLAAALGFPDHNYTIIHVAGSNGKGSVSTKIAKAYQCAGFKTGLYTSPHIATFRERICVNGCMISEQDVERLLTELFAIAKKQGIAATFFEMTTVLAFAYFAEAEVDVAVIETGLGGRLDATNIVTPILSIITSISLEHTELLGTTLDMITREKAGIIKPGVPVVIGPQVPRGPIEEIAQQQGSACVSVTGSFASYNEENNAIARRAMETLQLPAYAIEEGLKALPPCRLETHWLPQPVILDVAHNPDGLTRLFQSIRQRYPAQPLRIVCGLSATKDIAGCLAIIAEHSKVVHLVEADSERAAPIRALAAACAQCGLAPESVNPSVQSTVRLALDLAAQQGEVVVICGSFFIMAAAREALGLLDERDSLFVSDPAPSPSGAIIS